VYVPVLHTFKEVAVETSVAACVQSVSCTALRNMMRDAHDYLQTGPYRLLPRALDLNQVTAPQATTADRTARVEVDPCLSTSAQYILAQDRYIMEMESQIRSLRDFQFQRNDVLAQEEWKREMVIHDLAKERKNSYKMEVFHESREMALKAEIAELKGKVMEQELCNDYLSSQLLAYEDHIERQRRVLQELQEKEKKRAFTRYGLQDHCDALEDEAERATVDTTYNAHHLTHYIKCTEFL
jgi:hypothetical protein